MMRQFLYFGFVWLLSLLLASCRTTAITTTSADRADSIVSVRYVERIVRDTLQVQVPAESRTIVTQSDTSQLQTSFAISIAYVDSVGALHHTLENITNTLPVIVERVEVVRDSIVYRDRNHSVESSKKVTRPFPWYLLMIGFVVGVLASFVLVATSRR